MNQNTLPQPQQKMNSLLPVSIRPYDSEDDAWIYSSFLRSLQNQHPYRQLDKNLFYSVFHDLMEKLLTTKDCLIAFNPELQDFKYGYIVYEKPNKVFFIYVKHGASRDLSYRQKGIGNLLMSSALDAFPALPTLICIPTQSSFFLQKKWNLQKDSHILF